MMLLSLLFACASRPVKLISFNGYEVYSPLTFNSSSDTQPEEIWLDNIEGGQTMKINIQFRGDRVMSSGAPGHIVLNEKTGKGSIELYDELPGPGLWYITIYDEREEHFSEVRIMYFEDRHTGDTATTY